jgi:hypothetical protein
MIHISHYALLPSGKEPKLEPELSFGSGSGAVSDTEDINLPFFLLFK